MCFSIVRKKAQSYFQKLDLRLSYHRTISYLYPWGVGGAGKGVERREGTVTGKEGGK